MEDQVQGKRSAAAASDVTPEKKKARKSSGVGDHLICPITLELPMDPVMAEDGFTYERRAIEAHFKAHGTGQKSPMTNKPMGVQLTSATSVKNLIRFLIESKDIEGPLAENWKNRMEEKRSFDDLKRRAEQGDDGAAMKVGFVYFNGEKGVQKDEKAALIWFKKAAEGGNIRGMSAAATLMAKSSRTRTNAVALMAMAAQGGSDRACLCLGMWYTDGHMGLAKDNAQAKRLLQMVVDGSCAHKTCSDVQIDIARRWLKKLP